MAIVLLRFGLITRFGLHHPIRAIPLLSNYPFYTAHTPRPLGCARFFANVPFVVPLSIDYKTTMAVTTRPFSALFSPASHSTASPPPASSSRRFSTISPKAGAHTSLVHTSLLLSPFSVPSGTSASSSHSHHRRTRSSFEAGTPTPSSPVTPSPLDPSPSVGMGLFTRKEPDAAAHRPTSPPPDSKSKGKMKKLITKRPSTGNELKGASRTLRKAKSTANMLEVSEESAADFEAEDDDHVAAPGSTVDALTLHSGSRPRASTSSQPLDDDIPKFEEIKRFRQHRAGIQLHPYGQDAAYAQKYDSCTSDMYVLHRPFCLPRLINCTDSERFMFILLLRINPYPAFHDYGTKPPSRVLDLGCGQGYWVQAASELWKDTHFVGFDLVDVALSDISRTRDNVHFQQGNL